MSRSFCQPKSPPKSCAPAKIDCKPVKSCAPPPTKVDCKPVSFCKPVDCKPTPPPCKPVDCSPPPCKPVDCSPPPCKPVDCSPPPPPPPACKISLWSCAAPVDPCPPKYVKCAPLYA